MKAGARVIIALGSNLGDSRAIVRRAMDRLQELSSRPLLRSSLYETTPVDCPPGAPRFINAVVLLTPNPDETPESLLTRLQTIEQEFGRRPRQAPNEPRLLDLDLIAFGSEVRSSSQLTLPHARAHQRRFVLAPLAEIAAEHILPGQTKPVRELLAESDSHEVVTRLV